MTKLSSNRKDDLNYIVENYPILYKYVPIEVGCSILEKGGSVLFSKPSNLNDPFEYNSETFDCSKLDYSHRFFIDLINQNNSDSIGILSLSKDFNIILLWSYYAGNHRGVCIGYDTRKLVESILRQSQNKQDFISAVVKYPSRRTLKNSLVKQMGNLTDYSQLYFKILSRKNKIWKFEKEIRFASHFFNDQIVSLGEECICKLYLGARFMFNEPKLKARIVDLAKNKYSISLEQMQYNYKDNSLYPVLTEELPFFEKDINYPEFILRGEY